jgi:hypothetical protein
MSLVQELIKQLEISPETEILGVVDAGGVSGGGSLSSDGKQQWTLIITLSGWKPIGGELRKSELVIRKYVPEAEIHACMKSIREYEVVHVRARWSENNIFGSPQALLTEFIGKDNADSELNSYALKLQEPVTFTDPQFGLFTLNRLVNWYEASSDWCGSSIRLTIPARTPDYMDMAIALARRLWAEQEQWQRKIIACAIKELLELKNTAWLGEDEEEVNEKEFARRMVLESITIEGVDGTFEFWYNDGDLFWGHYIMVSGNLTDGPKRAGIEG